MQSVGSIVLPRNSVLYKSLSLSSQKLVFCDEQLLTIARAKKRLNSKEAFSSENAAWVHEREMQNIKYTFDLDRIRDRLRTDCILWQGTYYYLEHLYEEKKSVVRDLAQMGYQLSMACALGGLCCLITSMVIAGSNYRVSRNFTKPVTCIPIVFFAAGALFVGAYLVNLAFLLLMRHYAKIEALSDDMETEVSSLQSPRSSEDHFNSHIEDSRDDSLISISLDSPRERTNHVTDFHYQ